MSRRFFFGVLAGGAALVAVPKPILKPGDLNSGDIITIAGRYVGGNQLLSPAQITSEALRMLEKHLTFWRVVNHEYDAKFGDTIELQPLEPRSVGFV